MTMYYGDDEIRRYLEYQKERGRTNSSAYKIIYQLAGQRIERQDKEEREHQEQKTFLHENGHGHRYEQIMTSGFSECHRRQTLKDLVDKLRHQKI